jgi:anaerobic selenocysteine-containing dehydrogenase
VIHRLTVKRIEGRLAIEISSELAQAMGVAEGDAVYVTTPRNLRDEAGRAIGLDEGLALAEDAFRRYASTLSELAR